MARGGEVTGVRLAPRTFFWLMLAGLAIRVALLAWTVWRGKVARRGGQIVERATDPKAFWKSLAGDVVFVVLFAVLLFVVIRPMAC